MWALSKLFLNRDRLSAVTVPLCNLFQCWVTLWVKNLFLVSSLTLPWLSFMQFPRVLSLVTRVKRSASPHDQDEVSLQSSFNLFKAEQTKWPQPFCIRFPLKGLHHPCDPQGKCTMLSQGRFMLDIRKSLLTQRLVGQWKRIPREKVTAPARHNSRRVWKMLSDT